MGQKAGPKDFQDGAVPGSCADTIDRSVEMAHEDSVDR
jgi:hypothetical protein